MDPSDSKEATFEKVVVLLDLLCLCLVPMVPTAKHLLAANTSTSAVYLTARLVHSVYNAYIPFNKGHWVSTFIERISQLDQKHCIIIEAWQKYFLKLQLGTSCPEMFPQLSHCAASMPTIQPFHTLVRSAQSGSSHSTTFPEFFLSSFAEPQTPGA